MNDVKVSIIIPVYNPGELLNRCLDSASNQTLKDIEIICIDDGSSDGSLDILNRYAKNDSRFKVLSQPNLGAGIARNKGLEYANGEYIVFLDSDDFIESDMCECLYNHAKRLDSDLVLFNNRWYLGDNSTRDFIHFDSFEEDPKTFVFDYRFIHDLEFHIKSVLLAKRIAYCPKIFYHYNKLGHPSLQTKYVGKREAIVFYDVMVGIRDFLIEKGFMDEFRIDFLNFTFRHLYSKINEMEDGYKNEFFLKIKEFFESILITADEFNQMSFRNLPIYIHIVNSNSYEEFKLRMELFDMERLNPKKYPNLKETYNFLKDNVSDEMMRDFPNDLGDMDLESILTIEKQVNECNNFYIMRLEDIICEKDDEINKLESNIKKCNLFRGLKSK